MKKNTVVLAAVFFVCGRAQAGTVHIIASHTAPGPGHSPAELIPGNPNFHQNPIFQPNEVIYIWAHTELGQTYHAIGLDLIAYDQALISGPVTVPNPTCRWNGFVTGTPTVPPPVASITGIKMVCIPIVTCNVGVSNPVNHTNSYDGYNDPATESVMIATWKAAGTTGPCYFIVNNLLIVEINSNDSSVYFGWGDAPVDGTITGGISTIPDWYVGAAEDTDGDGIPNIADNCPYVANPDQTDTDGDGIGDACDNCPLVPNPSQVDSNGNGIGDACDTTDSDGDGIIDINDNCPNVANPDQLDTDGDGVGDACDNCPTVANADQRDFNDNGIGDACEPGFDSDGDGVWDGSDNCPTVFNPNQEDRDGDGFGDACDNCPTVSNANQQDTDGDGIGDACDNCPTVANANQSDVDHDGVGDLCDNCPTVPNPGQEDSNSDGIGDACDSSLDSDGDGVPDWDDNCPFVWNPDQLDTDGDGIGDICDNCPRFPNADQLDSDGDGVGDACDACPTRKAGDLNGDGVIDVNDVEPFVAILLNPPIGPPIRLCTADMDASGAINGRDIRKFVEAIVNGGHPALMRPSQPALHAASLKSQPARDGRDIKRIVTELRTRGTGGLDGAPEAERLVQELLVQP